MLLRENGDPWTGASWCEPLEARVLCAANQVRGDFTGDGRVDIVTTQGGLKLRVGTAKGFKAGVPINGVGFARGASVAAADFNNDGALDIAVFGGTSAPATLKGANGQKLLNGGLFQLLNNGDGTFKAPTQIGRLTGARVPGGQVVTGDFNLNGDQDILVTNGARNNTTPTPFVGTGSTVGPTATGAPTTGVTTTVLGPNAAGGTTGVLGGASSGTGVLGSTGTSGTAGGTTGVTTSVQPTGGLGPPAAPAVTYLFDGNGNGTFQSAKRIK